ncbi:hypothetical protein B0J11DRAFT_501793 [Dendryphion nanum]|uniref:Uncharacterized protein n=1 Tax=Dendryphion nanum TaxID=256645 RepID=A0A9P9EBQ3_9PLEO|nr:hypothetical protein B0J11DRAFT_501793 [Dendryphion nanum]
MVELNGQDMTQIGRAEHVKPVRVRERNNYDKIECNTNQQARQCHRYDKSHKAQNIRSKAEWKEVRNLAGEASDGHVDPHRQFNPQYRASKKYQGQGSGHPEETANLVDSATLPDGHRLGPSIENDSKLAGPPSAERSIIQPRIPKKSFVRVKRSHLTFARDLSRRIAVNYQEEIDADDTDFDEDTPNHLDSEMLPEGDKLELRNQNSVKVADAPLDDTKKPFVRIKRSDLTYARDLSKRIVVDHQQKIVPGHRSRKTTITKRVEQPQVPSEEDRPLQEAVSASSHRHRIAGSILKNRNVTSEGTERNEKSATLSASTVHPKAKAKKVRFQLPGEARQV